MENKTYEEAYTRLQEILRLLESDQLKVDELAAHLKEAKALVEQCKTKLRKIEEDLNE